MLSLDRVGELLTTASGALHLLKSSKKILFGVIVLLLLVVFGGLAPWLAPFDPNEQILGKAYLPPFWVSGRVSSHIFGTDSLGRDIFSRLLYGSSVALYVAVAATLLTAAVGVPLGIASGYLRGKFDEVVMRAVDIWMSFPPVLLAITLISILGTGLNNVILAIVVVDWTRFTRVIRSEVLNIREKDFVLAARSIGFSSLQIMKYEVLPNVIPLISIIATLEMGVAITVEVLLSYAGLGVKADTPSWGSMIADGLSYFRISPWGVLIPLITTIVVILGLNILGDGLREKLDPRLTLTR
ncbi:MAG: ABC transporter permease [Nitrososphaerales archaeon]